MKKTVVTLNRGVDVDAFINEMAGVGSTTPYVPTRKVEIYNLKPESLRNVDFLMTEAEAVQLRNDPRVLAVRLGTKAENGIEIRPAAIDTITKSYTRAPTYVAGNKDLNWALYDCRTRSNPFVGNTNTITSNSTPYTLTGNGVDVVIMDSGLQVDHPEFTDANGVSRVQQIDWWTSANQSGPPPWTPNASQNNMPTGFYTDVIGHGTNVGSIAVGKTYGWSINSNIYVMKVTSNATADSGAISASLGFNLIRLWHENKPVNPNTGFKAPTVINCSFVFGIPSNFTSLVTGGNYRGTTTWSGTIPSTTANTYGAIQVPSGQFYPSWDSNNSPQYPISEASINADVEDAIANGVIVIASAGNNGYKIDIPGGPDYNNYAFGDSISTIDGNRWYYHRGSSPASANGVIVVGAVDYTYNGFRLNNSYANTNATAKLSLSCCGPGVDVYAPGGMIAGATANSVPLSGVAGAPVAPYYENTSYKQAKMTGTSQSAPQVTGIVSCMLEANPPYTSFDVLKWIGNNSINNKLANLVTPPTGGQQYIAYTDPFNLQGSPLRYLYMPYQTEEVGSVNAQFPFPVTTSAGNIQGGFNL